MKYLVIDGYALAYRAYHGYPDLKNDSGRPTKVTVGFFRQILRLVQKPGGEYYHLVFVFDAPGGCFRKDLDASYKANRNKSEDSFYQQVDEIIKMCGLVAPTYQHVGYEADDLAGSFVNKYVSEEDEAVLVTVDADWLQLLSKNIRVLQLKTTGDHVFWDVERFQKFYGGLSPKQLVDVKALMGDGSDNVPGVRGVGWVTVSRLLSEYSSVENIYENILKITNKGKVQEKLIKDKERVLLNKRLCTIIREVPLTAPKSTTVAETGVFLDYLVNELQADSLANLMGLYFQLSREAQES